MSPGGPGGDGQNPLARFLVAPIAALVMSLLLMAMYNFAPQHEAKLLPNGPRNPKVQNGLWEQTDTFGLIDTQWSLRDGLAEGEALQYHSNGSLLRELNYRNGKLEGEMREYHEKQPYRRPPVRGRQANKPERMQAAGSLRKIGVYHAGIPTGPYQIYYPDGVLREEGIYRDGVKERAAAYDKDGRPKGQSKREDVWTPKQ